MQRPKTLARWARPGFAAALAILACGCARSAAPSASEDEGASPLDRVPEYAPPPGAAFPTARHGGTLRALPDGRFVEARLERSGRLLLWVLDRAGIPQPVRDWSGVFRVAGPPRQDAIVSFDPTQNDLYVDSLPRGLPGLQGELFLTHVGDEPAHVRLAIPPPT
jgi:hypothetical protein